jgi:hypothetical protein
MNTTSGKIQRKEEEMTSTTTISPPDPPEPCATCHRLKHEKTQGKDEMKPKEEKEEQQKTHLGTTLAPRTTSCTKGNKGAVNFFFLGGEGVNTADGSSSSVDEETLAFF